MDNTQSVFAVSAKIQDVHAVEVAFSVQVDVNLRVLTRYKLMRQT